MLGQDGGDDAIDGLGAEGPGPGGTGAMLDAPVVQVVLPFIICIFCVLCLLCLVHAL